jgi:hypothetical protein
MVLDAPESSGNGAGAFTETAMVDRMMEAYLMQGKRLVARHTAEDEQREARRSRVWVEYRKTLDLERGLRAVIDDSLTSPLEANLLRQVCRILNHRIETLSNQLTAR